MAKWYVKRDGHSEGDDPVYLGSVHLVSYGVEFNWSVDTRGAHVFDTRTSAEAALGLCYCDGLYGLRLVKAGE